MIAPCRRLALADSGRIKRKVEQDQRQRWQTENNDALP
jgi:post-segregation antitoxin (ccd killing protein)